MVNNFLWLCGRSQQVKQIQAQFVSTQFNYSVILMTTKLISLVSLLILFTPDMMFKWPFIHLKLCSIGDFKSEVLQVMDDIFDWGFWIDNRVNTEYDGPLSIFLMDI